MSFKKIDVKKVKVPDHVSKNAPLYAGGLLFMVIVKLAFVVGGLFVVALQQAKLAATVKRHEDVLADVVAVEVKKARATEARAKKSVKKPAKTTKTVAEK